MSKLPKARDTRIVVSGKCPKCGHMAIIEHTYNNILHMEVEATHKCTYFTHGGLCGKEFRIVLPRIAHPRHTIPHQLKEKAPKLSQLYFHGLQFLYTEALPISNKIKNMLASNLSIDIACDRIREEYLVVPKNLSNQEEYFFKSGFNARLHEIIEHLMIKF